MTIDGEPHFRRPFGHFHIFFEEMSVAYVSITFHSVGFFCFAVELYEL
jgi:hypothetical protein